MHWSTSIPLEIEYSVPVIEARGLTLRYKERLIQQNLDFVVNRGEMDSSV